MSGLRCRCTDSADAVVIGSGALGAATAFHLAERGRQVVLLDRFDLASQSSARAAGLSQQVQVDDVLAGLAVRGAEALSQFAALTGVQLDVVVNGSVKVARTEHDAEQLREEVAPRTGASAPRSRSSSPRRGRGRGSLARRAAHALEISLQPARPLHRAPGDAPAGVHRRRCGIAAASRSSMPRSPTSSCSDDAVAAVETTRGPHRDAAW